MAQTALRDAIGQVEIAELSMQRAHIDRQLKKNIEEKTEQWGVTIIDVEIRDIRLPQELQNAMSAEAQAQQERNARVVLAEVEKDISDMFIEAAHAYREDDLAPVSYTHLRTRRWPSSATAARATPMRLSLIHI